MKRPIILILTIVFLSKLLYSQGIGFSLVNFYRDKLYTGFIGSYPITMSIYYNDNEIFGSYYYERSKIPIKLTGKIAPNDSSSTLKDNDLINLKEFDNDTVKALITARIDSNELVGTWKNIETNKELPVNLKRIENQTTYIYNKYPLIRTIKNKLIEGDFSNYFEYTPTLDEFMEIKDNKGIYYLVLVSYDSRGEISYTQYCGNGLEEFLLFVGFNKNFEVTKSQIFKIMSCISSITTSCNESRGNDVYFSFKESGIWDFKKFKIEISNFSSYNEKIYELNTNNLPLGFVHVNTKKLK